MSSINVQQRLEVALGHHQAGRLAQAEALYRQILAQFPQQPDALHLLGMLAYETRNYPAAIALIEQAITQSPAAEFYANLGLVQNALRDYSKSESSYNQALRLKPDYPQAWLGFGVARFHQGDLPGAIEAYRQAIQLNPDLAEAHNNLGNVLKDSGQLADAIDCYRKSLALSPDDPETTVNLGQALHYSGQIEQSIATLHHATELDPNLEQAFSQLGAALRDKNDIEGARRAYRRALQIGSAKSVIYKSLAAYLDPK
jgi:tetratricopeptide (TPR) repeat protein